MLIAALCVLLPLWSSPGRVSADTKSYLYLDPGRLLSRATSLWDPSVGAGTVAHQVAGYLWPMGPYFWLMEQLGCADWVAQRLWWSLLALFASFGMLRLARVLGLSETAACIAAIAYAFSPYSLQYLARLSGLLTPWALLPWMLLCVVHARAGNTLRWSLAMGALIATAGSVNVTALAMVFLGVITWMVVDVATGVVLLRRHAALLAGSLATSLACGAWWIAALVVQGRYGLPILRYTETYETVAKASTPQEILRGLGYWFFYGNDYSGAWVDASTRLIGTTPLLALGMLVSAAALIAVGLARHRHSRHCAALLVVGLAVAVGSNPQGATSLYGRLFESVVNNESGFALRSSPRATPVVLVALAVSLGFTWDRYSPLITKIRLRVARPVLLGLIVLLLTAQNYPWMTGHLLTPAISRDETLPAYWTDTARAIDDVPHSESTVRRTYELPGVDFATYTWGGTIDPVTPGLIDSQYLARELVPYGSDATADLLNAFESRLQEGRFEPSSLPDVVSLFGANTVTFRGDVRYDAYRTPNPGRLWRELSMTGLDVRHESPHISTNDATSIADATFLAHPRATSFPATAVLQATPQPLVSVSPVSDHTRLVGSGDGVIDAVTALGRDSLGTFVYDATADLSRAPLGTPGRVIVTDSNRRQSRRWYSVGSNLGRTERADEDHGDDPSDNRLMPFVDDHAVVPKPSTQSVSLLVGDIKTVTASNYGHPIVSTPEDRPENAFDGDPYTSWRTGIIGRSVGQHIDATFHTPVRTSQITLAWPRVGNVERRITKGRIILYTEDSTVQRSVSFSVTDRETHTGVLFPETTFTRVRVIIDDDTFGVRDVYDGLPGTGIAEVTIPGVANKEFVLAPSPARETSSISDTSYVFSRWRLDEATPNRSDPEVRLLRAFDRTNGTEVNVSGILRLNGSVDDATLVKATGGHSVTAVSDSRLAGSPFTSAMTTLDGDSSSAWVTPLDNAVGSRIHFTGLAASPSITISFLDDAWHSRPAQLELTYQDGTSALIDVPATGDAVTVRPPKIANALTRLTITEISPRYFPDYFSRKERQLPVAISEVRVGESQTVATTFTPGECRSDLLTMNDSSIAVRLIPLAQDAVSPWEGGDVAFESCSPVTLTQGRTFIESTSGRTTGWNVDRVVLSPTQPTTEPVAPVPARIVTSERTRIVAEVPTAGSSLLSLNASNNRGWRTTFTGPTGSRVLRDSFVVNGFAHGVIAPGPGTVTFEWIPQKWYSRAMWLSFVAGSLTLIALIALARRRTEVTPPSGQMFRSNFIVSAISILVLLIATPPVALIALTVTTLLLFTTGYLKRRVLVVIAAVSYATLTAFTVISQIVHRYPVTLDWPGRFDSWGTLAWLSVGLVALASWMYDCPDDLVNQK